MSNLTAIELIANNSAATTGLWNQRLSTISANFAALNSDLTINFPSGDTLSVFSNIDASGRIHAGQQVGIGATPSAVTTAVLTIAADSSKSDYIHFEDSSAGKSSYMIGSRVGGTADGLNIYDLSGDTMIVSFSKQSVRYYTPVVGPVVDSGGQYVNVRAFGAKGDDSTDDTASLHLAASAASGNILYFPTGTYKITSAVTIYSNTIVLMQPGSVVKQYTEASRAFYASGTSNVKLRDCTIDYNTVAVRRVEGAIEVVNSTNFEIIGCRIVKGPGLGIYTANNRRGRILSNIVEDTLADGIHVTNGGQSNNSSRDITIVNNVTNNTGDDGIAVVSYTADGQAICEAITVTANVVGTCATRAITIAGGQFVTVTANTVRDTAGSTGINIMLDEAFSTFSASDIVVANNVIEPGSGAAASTRAGIRVYRSPRCVVIGNIVDWQAGHGIQVYGTSAATVLDGQVIGNMVRGTTTGNHGIILQHAQNARVEGNTILDATSSGIRVENFDTVQVLNNTIKEGNQGNVAATNLMGVVSGQRASVIGNSIWQTTNSYQHGIAYSLVTDLRSAHNVLRRSVAQSGDTINVFSCDSVDISDGLDSQGVPPLHTNSEISLGWYRSSASVMALSYGTLRVASDVSVGRNIMAATRLSVGTHIPVARLHVVDAVGTNVHYDSLASRHCVIEGGEARLQIVADNSGNNNAMVLLTGAPSSGSNHHWGLHHRAGGVQRFEVFYSKSSSAGDVGGVQDVVVYSCETRGAINFRFQSWHTDGSSLTPGSAFSSERSLGWYRSGASNMALSYGTLNLATGSAHLWASGLSIGNATAGGSLIPAISSTSSRVAAFVVQPSASSFTHITWAAVQPGDQILTTIQADAAASSMSSGLVAHSHCTVAGRFEFRLSNVSTLVQNQSQKTWYFTRISPF